MSEKAGLRDQLIDAGEALVEELGLDQPSLRDVAKRCEVSHNAPYRHFKSKEALLAAVAARGFRALRLLNTSRRASGEAPLRAFVSSYLEFAKQRPAILRLMIGPTIRDYEEYPDLQSEARQAFEQVLAAVDFAAEGRSITASRRLAVAAWATVHGLAHLQIETTLGFLSRDEIPMESDLETMLRAGLTALATDVS